MGTRPLTRPSARRLFSPSLGRRGGSGRPRRLAVGRSFPLRFGSGRQSTILAPSGGRRPPEGLNGGQRTRRATGAALVGPSAISSLYPAAIPSPFRRLCALRAAPTVDESRLPFIVFGSAGKRWTECFCLPDFALVVDGAASGAPLGAPDVVRSEAVQDSRPSDSFGAEERWDVTSCSKSECRRRWCCPPTTRTAAAPPRNGAAASVASPVPRSLAVAVDGWTGDARAVRAVQEVEAAPSASPVPRSLAVAVDGAPGVARAVRAVQEVEAASVASPCPVHWPWPWTEPRGMPGRFRQSK